jgi:hypothetical protein
VVYALDFLLDLGLGDVGVARREDVPPELSRVLPLIAGDTLWDSLLEDHLEHSILRKHRN